MATGCHRNIPIMENRKEEKKTERYAQSGRNMTCRTGMFKLFSTVAQVCSTETVHGSTSHIIQFNDFAECLCVCVFNGELKKQPEQQAKCIGVVVFHH